MNYHIENLQGQRNAADGIIALVDTLVTKVSPEQYHIDGAARDIKKLEDKCDKLERQVKSLTGQLEEADIAVEAIE